MIRKKLPYMIKKRRRWDWYSN